MSWFGGSDGVECFGGPADGYVLEGKAPDKGTAFIILIPPFGLQEAVYEWGRNWRGRKCLMFKEIRDVEGDPKRWPKARAEQREGGEAAGPVGAPGEAADRPDGPPEDAPGLGDEPPGP